MSKSPYQALELALALLRTPALAAQVRERPLPADVLTLIRIAAGDDTILTEAAAASGETPQRVAEAAVLFLQQTLFRTGADSYRLLGAPATAPQELLKLHHRWLVRWLHPDHQADDWQAAYMSRVNRAWQDLRTPARRNQYDKLAPYTRDTRAAWPAPGAAPITLLPLPVATEGGRRLDLSGPGVRRLLSYLLTAALCAAAALSVRYWGQHAPNTPAIATTPSRLAHAGSELPTAHRPTAPHRATDKPAVSGRPQVTNIEPSPQQAVADSSHATLDSHAAAPAPRQIAAADTPGATDSAPSPLSAVLPKSPRPHHPPPTKPATTWHPTRTKAAIVSNPTTPAAPAGDGLTTPMPTQATSVTTAVIFTRQSPPAAITALPDAALQALPTHLADAYQRGDLAALLRLFAPEIQTEHGGYAPTTTAYQVLFASSTQRTLTLHDIDWQRLGADRAIGRAQFESTIQPRGPGPSRSTNGTLVLHVIALPSGMPVLASLRFEDGP